MRRLLALSLAAAVLAAAGAALAYYTGGSATAQAGTLVGGLGSPGSVSAQASGPAVDVSWSAVTAPGGGNVGGYYVQRVENGSTTAACGSSPTNLLAGSATGCTDTGNPAGDGVPGGTYTYQVTAVWRSFTATGAVSGVVVAPPSVASAAPAAEPQGATATVTITGTNFVNGATVSFANPGITVESTHFVSVTEIKATIEIASGAATGTGNVSVTNPDGDTATGSGAFTVDPGPVLTAVSSDAADQGASFQVTISGNGFENGATVSFSNPGITVASSSVSSATQISAEISVGSSASTGASSVTVTNPDGSSATIGGSIYWADYSTDTIGRADLSGANVNQSFITGVNGPFSLALDSSHLYWGTTSGPIGRSNLDGSSVNDSFITGAYAYGVAVSPSTIYWGDQGSNEIGYAALDGSNVNQSWLSAFDPRQIAVDSNYIYWTEAAGDSDIGRATLSGTDSDQTFIQPASGDVPLGLAVNGSYIYWTQNDGEIGRANLNGTGVDQSFITGLSVPKEIALDGNYIYWANSGTNSIGRATLSGGNVDPTFITGASGASAVAVNAAFTVDPAPAVGSASPSSEQQGASDQTVTITGSGFENGATLTFAHGSGITDNSLSYVSPTQLTATVSVSSSASTGADQFTVSNPDGSNATGSLTVAAGPSVTSLSPGSADAGATDFSVTVHGSGFDSGANVTFSGSSVTVSSTSYVSGSQLTVSGSIASNATPGAVNVTVANPNGSSTTDDGAFTINAAPSLAPSAVAAAYEQTVLGTSGLAAFFPLSSDYSDAASGGPGMTNYGTTIESSGGVWNNGYAEFPGSGQYTNITSNPWANSTSFTWEGWVKWSGAGAAWQRIFDFGNGTCCYVMMTVNNGGSGTPRVDLYNNGTVEQTTAWPSALPSGSWQYVVVTESGGTVTEYDDGTEVVSEAGQSLSPASIGATSNNWLGRSQYSADAYFDGGEQDVALYTTALSAQQVATHYGDQQAANPASAAPGASNLSVTLNGSGFESGATVSFANSGITVNSVSFVSANQLTVNISVGAGASTGAGNVTVTNPDGSTATGTNIFTVS